MTYTKFSIGDRIGELILIEYVGQRSGKRGGQPIAHWLCQCDCGSKAYISSSALSNKKRPTATCGKCIRSGERHANWTGCGRLSGYHWSCIKRDARVRDIQVDVTIEYAWSLYEEQDGKCAFTGWDIEFHAPGEMTATASLDRIDSSKGYIEGNLQWVHKYLNQAKNDLNDEFFIFMCNAVTKHRG